MSELPQHNTTLLIRLRLIIGMGDNYKDFVRSMKELTEMKLTLFMLYQDLSLKFEMILFRFQVIVPRSLIFSLGGSYVPNLSLQLCLEPRKFYGGAVVVGGPSISGHCMYPLEIVKMAKTLS